MSKLHSKTIGNIIYQANFGSSEMRKKRFKVFHELLDNHSEHLTPSHLHSMMTSNSDISKKIINHPVLKHNLYAGTLDGHYAVAILNHESKYGSDEVKQIAKRILETGE